MFLFEMPAVEDHPHSSSKWLIVFTADESPTAGEIGAAVQDHIALRSTPDRICIVGFQFNQVQLQTIRYSDELADRLPPLLRAQQDKGLWHLSIQNDGILYVEAGAPSRPANKMIVDRIRRAGLFTIFDIRQGLLGSTETFHYIKPSGSHCRTFLRTAQVLVDGEEIDFIAGWLLPYIADDVTEFWCDTAAISSVAYAVARIKRLLAPDFRHPRISSFSSYDRFQSAPIGPSCLVLISASTAGRLAQELQKVASIAENRIVTLFYLQGSKPSGVILCDLTIDSEYGADGYAHVENYSPESCPCCRDGSSAIRMKGEHFLPHDTDVVKVLITAKQAPSWISPFVRMCHGWDVIRVHHRKGRRGEIHELFVDADSLLHSDTVFAARFVQMLVRSLPTAARQIIHLADRGSEAMASAATQFLRESTGKFVPVIAASEVTKFPNQYRVETGATIVIASCIASGRGLMEIGQVLRTIQTNKAVVFFVGLSRLPAQKDLDQVISNLTYTPDPRERFLLYEVEHIFIPDSTAMRPSIWSKEVKFLQMLRRQFLSETTFPEGIIAERIARIHAAEGTDIRGLRQDVFFGDVNGKPLRLRPNFAFLKFDYEDRGITQAEVFFVIASILNELRNGSRPVIRQQEFRRVVIDPQTFNRLNDGIVQAALLRASLPAELDYRLKNEMSSDMAEFLAETFSACQDARGEATPEFLLALAMGQLHLLREDLRMANDVARTKVAIGSIEDYLCRYIADNLA